VQLPPSLCRPCRRCAAPVIWTVTDAGRRLAVDPEPDPEGNTAVLRDQAGTVRSRRPNPELPLQPWEDLYMPHIATCLHSGRNITASRLPDGVASLQAHRRTHTGGTR